jgi:hypothetical protein
MQALVNLSALAGLFPHRVARLAQLAALGLGPAHGRRLLPGVVMLGKAPPGRDQLVQAALLYAGSRSMVTGMDALRLHGIIPAVPGPVQVLAPTRTRARSTEQVRVMGTARFPEPVLRKGFPCTSVAHAAIDAVRALDTVDQARTLLTGLVRGGHLVAGDLRAALGTSRSAGSALARRTLKELEAGARTPAESWAENLLRGSGLPAPSWNASLRDTDGRFLAVVDAWWPEAGLVWEFGEPPWHAPILTAAGLRVVTTPATRLRREPTAVAAELRDAYKYAARRTTPCAVSI